MAFPNTLIQPRVFKLDVFVENIKTPPACTEMGNIHASKVREASKVIHDESAYVSFKGVFLVIDGAFE